MDWNRVEGDWKQMKGKIKEKWGNLTDDDLDVINGRREQALLFCPTSTVCLWRTRGQNHRQRPVLPDAIF
ncbi:MAG: CsbD family protein [Pseudolabrys sp.]